MTRILVASAFALCAFTAVPTNAATTVFAGGVYSQSGAVANVGNSFGAADGAVASVGGFFSTGEIVLTFGTVLSGADIQLNSVDRFLGSNLAISIGEVIGGVAVFSPEQLFTETNGGIFNFDLSGGCSAISSYGCSLVRIRHTGGFSLGFGLDGVSAVSAAPEPSSWAMMIFGFVLVAGRLKRRRDRNGLWTRVDKSSPAKTAEIAPQF